MDKPIVNMINWTIVKGDEDYFLHGTCDYHPYLGKNAFVSRTSPLEKYTFEDDILNYETRHTVYSCPLKYMSVDMFGRLVNKSVSIMLERVKDSDDLLDKLIEACAKIVLGYEDNAFMSRIKEIQAIGQEEIKKTYRRD